MDVPWIVFIGPQNSSLIVVEIDLEKVDLEERSTLVHSNSLKSTIVYSLPRTFNTKFEVIIYTCGKNCEDCS